MKNILVYFASHEVNQSVLITDISSLLDSNREMKEAKDAINGERDEEIIYELRG